MIPVLFMYRGLAVEREVQQVPEQGERQRPLGLSEEMHDAANGHRLKVHTVEWDFDSRGQRAIVYLADEVLRTW